MGRIFILRKFRDDRYRKLREGLFIVIVRFRKIVRNEVFICIFGFGGERRFWRFRVFFFWSCE